MSEEVTQPSGNEPSVIPTSITEVITEKTSPDLIKEAETIYKEAAPKSEPVDKPREFTDIEKRAMEQGWRPETEFDKTKGKRFRDAEEFIERGELFARMDELKKQAARSEALARQTAEHIAKVKQSSYEKALNDLNAQRLQAYQQGNLEAAQKAEQAMANEYKTFQEQQPRIEPAPQPQQPELNDLQKDFLNRNGFWFNKNPTDQTTYLENQKMITDAHAIEQWITQARPDLDERTRLGMVEMEIRNRFPHRFENQNRNAPSPVAGVTAATSNKPSTRLSERLSPQQRSFGTQAVRMKAYDSIEDYAKDLEMMGELK